MVSKQYDLSIKIALPTEKGLCQQEKNNQSKSVSYVISCDTNLLITVIRTP
jgi:hypothetical protein